MTLERSRNAILKQMQPADRRRLGRHFVAESLEFKQVLHEQGAVVDMVYFPESGVVSLVTDFASGAVIETGTVGNEGVVGVPAILGVRQSPGRTLCQIPGRALRVPAVVMAGERDRGSHFFKLLLRYANFVGAMAAQTAACNRMHSVDTRLSRWLLMTHDRVDSDNFLLTQQFLAQMLGVTRPTVNTAGALLQRAGFIRYSRGRIAILDRNGLEAAACECYGRIRTMLEESMNGEPRPRTVTRPRSRTPAERGRKK